MSPALDPLIRDALCTAAGPGGVVTDADAIAPWLTDWRGHYRGASALLLQPACTADVAAILRVTHHYKVPLTVQGGNTGLTQGSVPNRNGAEILLSTRRLNRIRSVDAVDFSLTAEAGVVLAQVQAAAEKVQRLFPLSLASEGSACIGGLIATNAGGVQVLRYGPMRALVLGLEAVLPNGDILHALSSLRKDNSGYDVKQWLIGAEGTLGIITAATLKLFPRPTSRDVAWVGVSSPAAALALLGHLRATTGDALSALELMSADVLDLVWHHFPNSRPPLRQRWPWQLLVEATDSALAESLAMADVGEAILAHTATQAEALWQIRETIPLAEKAHGRAIKHDIAVPVGAVPDFLLQAETTLHKTFPGARMLVFGHVGDGNLHVNIAPPTDENPALFLEKSAEVSRLVHDLALSLGGTITAEHGIGRLRIAELARTADPVKLALMRTLKTALDPHNLLNPGRVLATV